MALLGHELRNPLAAILNGVQALRMIDAGTSDAGQIQDLIERQANHMARLTDDLLDVSRISSGKIQLRKNWVELVELVRNTTDMHRRQMLHNRLQFEVRLPERPLWVHADATRLSQVVGNLLMNALKFTDPGGQVTASLETSGDQATISVKDTGIGMDVDLLQRVFEPFAQADTSLDRSRGGLGLGIRAGPWFGRAARGRSRGTQRWSGMRFRVSSAIAGGPTAAQPDGSPG